MSQEPTTRMPTNVAETHSLLGRELFLLYTEWNDYKTLYCKDDESVQLLDYAASFFFRILREVLRDDIMLTVCRITDPAASNVRGTKRKNLTIEYLVSIIPPADSSLQHTLKSMLSTIAERCALFRTHRNRRIGHHDLDTRLKRSNSVLPGIDINEVDEALNSIADALKAVERHYDKNEQSYEQGIYGLGDGAGLIDFIKHEKELRKYHDHKEFADPT